MTRKSKLLIDIKAAELQWITAETVTVLSDLKHGLEDCYALLAPIDPGSTLVMSTSRSEKVKGTITRVGTRIVKGTLSLQLRMLPQQTLALSQSHAIHIHALDQVHTHLTESLDLLSLTLGDVQTKAPDADSLAQTLTLLADSLASSAALLKGPPLNQSDATWQTSSCPPEQFIPALPPQISVHITLQDSCVVLWLRALEPVHAPVHFGMKLGLAIGTVRRLEHDEMDIVFKYNPAGWEGADSKMSGARHSPDSMKQASREQKAMEEVYVREKVRVESADPSLISLYSKLGYLSHMLGQARRNLAAVMGAEEP